MPNPAKSQWDFGELFPMQPARKVLSVTQLTAQVRGLLEKHVGVVWVMGEVTNLKSQNSGHIYFTLKDAAAQLSCVLFRGELQVDRTLVQDGRKITVRGELTVYEARGQYQLRVLAVELEGLGALQAAFEKLKQKLNAEGLFAPARKRLLPRYPQRIGLVTSPTGAAIRDVLHVIRRRHPALEITFAPCRVQGAGAASEIASAIRLLNQFAERAAVPKAPGTSPKRPALELILLTRGGGSLEDLWAFNEEIVARAIFHSQLPVVCGVGHEIDFTIADFVADVRAATPSAAAEIITEGVFASCKFVAESGARLRQRLRQRLEEKKQQRQRLAQRLARLHPRRRLQERAQRLDDLQAGLLRSVAQRARESRLAWYNLVARLSRVRPAVLLRQRADLFQQVHERLREQVHHRLREWRQRQGTLVGRLELLGPEQVLARGYSITTDAATGKIVRSAGEVQRGQLLKSRFKDGARASRVED